MGVMLKEVDHLATALVITRMAEDRGGTIGSQKSSELLDADAIDVTIETPDRKVYGTAAIVNDRVVVVEYGAAKPDRDVFERFRDSVRVN